MSKVSTVLTSGTLFHWLKRYQNGNQNDILRLARGETLEMLTSLDCCSFIEKHTDFDHEGVSRKRSWELLLQHRNRFERPLPHCRIRRAQVHVRVLFTFVLFRSCCCQLRGVGLSSVTEPTIAACLRSARPLSPSTIMESHSSMRPLLTIQVCLSCPPLDFQNYDTTNSTLYLNSSVGEQLP